MAENIKGLDDLLKKLAKLKVDVPKELEKTMDKNVKLVQAQAKLLVPTDTGRLHNSITTEVKVLPSEVQGIVTAGTSYALFVEFGTGQVGRSTNTNTEVKVTYKDDKWLANIPGVGFRYVAGQPAKPFMYPALKATKNEVVKRIKQDLQKKLQEVSEK